MSTTYTTNVGLGCPALDDQGWDSPIRATIALLDSLGPVGALGVRFREIPSTSLFVAIAPGHFRSVAGAYVAYAGATVAVPASTTTYLWLDDSGTLATGTGWPSAAHVRLAVVAAGATTLASVTDARVAFGSATGTA